MGSMANVALAALKNSDELKRQSLETSVPRKKTARISELLADSVVKNKLPDLASAAAADGEAVPRSPGSTVPTSLMTTGSGGGSGAASGSGGGSGSLQGGLNSKWRRAGKAVVATKVLAGRPKAGLAQGRPVQALQAMREDRSAQDLRQAASSGLIPDLGKGGGWSLGRLWAAATEKLPSLNMAKLVIRPETKWYHVHWFYYAVLVALLSCWVEPFSMAFTMDRAQSPIWIQVAEYVIIVTFVLDFLFKFFVAYFCPETGMLVSDQPKMAFAYMKSVKFALDVLGCFPYDMLVTAISKSWGVSDDVISNLDWLKLLSLTRAYRVFDLFQVLDYHMILSQGSIMLLRNYTYVLFTSHWAACVFYHLAREEGVTGDRSWVGRNAEAFIGHPLYEQYILSLYFAITVFTAMGDPRLFPFTPIELAIMTVYLLFNLFLAAYIIGTVTIMMVQRDEHSKAFRESISHLQDYSRENDLPDRLHKAMREHLEVHFDSEETADDKVLGIYPTTIRRRALRHLYLQPIKNCYVFRNCKQRFLDAVLSAARVELFLPGVEIITEGDNVVELLIVVAGEVAVTQGGSRMLGPAASIYGASVMTGSVVGSVVVGSTAGSEQSYAPSGASQSFTQSFLAKEGTRPRLDDNSTSGAADVLSPMLSPGGVNVTVPAAKGSTTLKGSGDAVAEIAYFTDSASYETVVGTTPVRVLSLPKTAWDLLVQQFPQQVRVVLENVQRAAEVAIEENLKAAGARSQLTGEQLQIALSLVTDQGAFADTTDPTLLAETRDALTHYQLEMITRLDDIRSMVSTHVRKCDEMRTFEFLNTAAMGDTESLRTMLSQGISPNTADYDGRTGLMLAAAKGHHDTVRLLLDSGADKDKTDAFGISALAEAAKNAHDSVIELLLSYGATLGSGGLAVASEMCTAVYQDDLVKLRRLLRSGAPPDACDYDKRSALHIAGAEGNLAAVKLLIEEGGADPNFQDRWGNTALDEARRVGAGTVMTYLEARQTQDVSLAAEKRRQQVAHEFMAWCNQGEVAKLKQAGGYSYGDEAGCAFSGLLVASSKGHRDVVEVLLEGMPPATARQHGHVAMLEAARMGHPHTVAAFRAAGVSLPDSSIVSLRYLAAEMRNAAQQGNGAVVEALLAAGLTGRLSAAAGEGGAPMLLAVEHSHLGVTRRLVERGGVHQDLSTPDGLGRTPLALATAVLAKRPNDSRAKTVHEYLAWATPMAAGGATMAQMATAATERFGPIGFHGSVPPSATVVGTGPAFSAVAALVAGSVGVDGVALIGPAPAGGLGWEKGAVNPMQAAAGRAASLASPLQVDGGGGGGGGPPLSRRGSTLLTPSPGSGGNGAAGGALEGVEGGNGGAVVAAEAWDNLPGTPGNSTRGSTRAASALRQHDAHAAAGASDAKLLYNATMQHSAALLNEPPSAFAAAAAAAGASALGALRHSLGAVPVPSSPVPAAGGMARGNSVSLGAGSGPGGLASPSLQMPPSMGASGAGGLLSPGAQQHGRLLLSTPPGGNSSSPFLTGVLSSHGAGAAAASPVPASPLPQSRVGSGIGPSGVLLSQASRGPMGSGALPAGPPEFSGSRQVPGSANGMLLVPAASSPGPVRPGSSRGAASRLFGDAAAAAAAANGGNGMGLRSPPEAAGSTTSLVALASPYPYGTQRALNSPVCGAGSGGLGRPQSPSMGVAPWRRASAVIPVPEDDIEEYVDNLAPAPTTATGEDTGVATDGSVAAAGAGSPAPGPVPLPSLARIGSRLGMSMLSRQRSQASRGSEVPEGAYGGAGAGGLTSPASLHASGP